ncbi:MAG: hypothetical protein WCF23_03745 [Candidatus Nitrosopolaris sp.]
MINRTYVFGYESDMETGIQLLEIASGLRKSLLKAGFTVDSISSEGPDTVSTALGIEPYLAKIIYTRPKRSQLKVP